MSDLFSGIVTPKHIDDEAIIEIRHGENSGNDWAIQDENYWLAVTEDHAKYASHAINYHDHLVDMVYKLAAFLDDRVSTAKEMQLSSDARSLLEICK